IEKNFFYVAIFLSLGFLFQFFSCKIQSKDNDSSSAQHKEVAAFEPTQTWHVGNECICILFGYGYNDKDFVESVSAPLYEKYGKEEDGGLIKILVFPDDFKKGSKSIAAELPLHVGTKTPRGVITLGAPENTHFGLAHIQDTLPANLFVPIISFFPQDNVIGIEGTSDIVLDKVQNTNGIEEEIVEPESSQVFVKDVPLFVERSVSYCLSLDVPLSKNADLLNHLKAIVGNKKIDRYVDPETGLPSVNHFVLQ
ncbi:MAG: hypothetical protein IKI31_04980, partial [Treponema sp.]|nr:hypothetical protein [Treponema sp.]